MFDAAEQMVSRNFKLPVHKHTHTQDDWNILLLSWALLQIKQFEEGGGGGHFKSFCEDIHPQTTSQLA